MSIEKKTDNRRAKYHVIYAKKIVILLILTVFSVLSHPNFAQKIRTKEEILAEIPKDTITYFKCLEKKGPLYCDVRHSHSGGIVGCVVSNRVTAEAVDWKRNGLTGRRNTCVFDIEFTQFRLSDGVLVKKLTVKPNEIFGIDFTAFSDGAISAACRSPLIPVYDLEAPLKFRCVKK